MEINMRNSHLLKKGYPDTWSTHLVDLRLMLILGVASIILLNAANTAQAGERESLEQLRSTTTNLVNLLVQEGVLSKDKADGLLKQAAQEAQKAKEKDAVAASNTNEESVDTEIDKKMVRVQYVPDIVKNEMKEEIKKEVMTKLNYKAGTRLGMPEWIDRLTWEGTLRIRAEHNGYGENNPTAFAFNAANNTNIRNTTEDRDRLRVRAQLGVRTEVNDWMSGGIRMVTGNLDDSLSPNQNVETASSKYTIGLDRAFLNAKINPWLNVVGGRFASPWFSTDLVWDPDLAFDGIAASFTPKYNDKLSGFITLGAFPIDEIEQNNINKAKDKWMYGGQAGINWKFNRSSSAKLALALYDFKDIEGISNGFDAGVSGPFSDTRAVSRDLNRTKGNSAFNINASNSAVAEQFGLSSKFRELNLTGQVDVATFSPVHVVLTGDYVKNIGFDKNEILRRTGTSPKEETDGYQVRLSVGMPETDAKGKWQVYGAYKYLEADAVLDSFTDSGFYLRGTNAKGWLLGGSYGIDKNTWVSARWFSADEITPRSTSIGGAPLDPLSVDVFMLDLDTKF
jgi:hypothetical protein